MWQRDAEHRCHYSDLRGFPPRRRSCPVGWPPRPVAVRRVRLGRPALSGSGLPRVVAGCPVWRRPVPCLVAAGPVWWRPAPRLATRPAPPGGGPVPCLVAACASPGGGRSRLVVACASSGGAACPAVRWPAPRLGVVCPRRAVACAPSRGGPPSPGGHRPRPAPCRPTLPVRSRWVGPRWGNVAFDSASKDEGHRAGTRGAASGRGGAASGQGHRAKARGAAPGQRGAASERGRRAGTRGHRVRARGAASGRGGAVPRRGPPCQDERSTLTGRGVPHAIHPHGTSRAISGTASGRQLFPGALIHHDDRGRRSLRSLDRAVNAR